MSNLQVGSPTGSPSASKVAPQDAEKRIYGVDAVASAVGQGKLTKQSEDQGSALQGDFCHLTQEVQSAIDGLRAVLTNCEQTAQEKFKAAMEEQIKKVGDLKSVLSLYPKQIADASELQNTELGKAWYSLREKTIEACSAALTSGKAFLSLFQSRMQALEIAREDRLFEKAYLHALVVGRSSFLERVKDFKFVDPYHGTTHEYYEAKRTLDKCRSDNGIDASETSPSVTSQSNPVSDALAKSRLLSSGIYSLKKEVKCFDAATKKQPVILSARPKQECISHLQSLEDYEKEIAVIRVLYEQRVSDIKKSSESKDGKSTDVNQLKVLSLEEKELHDCWKDIEEDLAGLKLYLVPLKSSLKVTDQDIAAANAAEENSPNEFSHSEAISDASDLLNSFAKLRKELSSKNSLFPFEDTNTRRINCFKNSAEFNELEAKKTEFENGAFAKRQKVIDDSIATYKAYKDAMDSKIKTLEEALVSFDIEIQERARWALPVALSSPKKEHSEGSPSKDQAKLVE